MISEAVYEQVVAELNEVRHAWQANLRDTALAEERAERAEAELQEALKELEIRKRELITCREAKLAADVQIQKLTNMGKEI